MTGASLRDWTPERDDVLRTLHGTMPIPQIAAAMGRTRGSVRARITKLGIRKRFDAWAPEEIEQIKTAYLSAPYDRSIGLARLAERLGRNKVSVCKKAADIGLTILERPLKPVKRKPRKFDTSEQRSAAARERLRTNHPRGFAGKRHSEAAKQRSRQASNDWWGSLTPQQKEDHVTATLKAAIAKNGRIGPIVNTRATTWKAGWREIGDKRHYFRSRWEANYARYLQWLKERGDILEWEYEPETFWFDKIKRGVRSYLPDFRIHELNGSKPLHEVKGWMDARSKTTLKRMAKYHPEETIILIREKEYRALSRFSALIGGWE